VPMPAIPARGRWGSFRRLPQWQMSQCRGCRCPYPTMVQVGNGGTLSAIGQFATLLIPSSWASPRRGEVETCAGTYVVFLAETGVGVAVTEDGNRELECIWRPATVSRRCDAGPFDADDRRLRRLPLLEGHLDTISGTQPQPGPCDGTICKGE